MQSYSKLFNQMIDPINIRIAINNASKGKRDRNEVKAVLGDIDKWIPIFQGIAHGYKNSPHVPKQIYDGISRKVRTIIVPTFREQVIHHMAVNVLKPIFEKSMYFHSYGSLPNKGGHLGKKYIEKWIRKDAKNTKYYLKMDIRHFFDSIPHSILKQKLSKIIRDKQFLDVINEIIDVQTKGIPLGFYTSQWIANWYLTELDYYIKQDLGAVYYMRYMDDMVILGSNKRKLHKMRVLIQEYLRDNLGLELKPNYQVKKLSSCGVDNHPLDYMGFKFYRCKTTLRSSIFLKAKRKAKRISKKKPTVYDARQMLSYLGWFSATDSYKAFRKWIKPYISVRMLKRLISRTDRRKYAV